MDADGKYTVFSNDKTVIAQSIAPQCDGKLLVGGSDRTGSGVLARLAADGSLDQSFTRHVWLKGTGTTQVKGVLLQPDGKVVVSGNVVDRPFVARLWP